MSHLFCFGLGYSAAALASRLTAEGWRISGTSRSPDGVARLRAAGHDGLAFAGDARSPDVARTIALASHVLVSAPPDIDGDPVLRHHAGDLATAPGLCWIGYLSTVGVYGDHGGGWVDEDTEPRPATTRSRLRLAAEDQWRDFAVRTGRHLFVLRLSGIYGPGRNALENLQDGTARRIIKPGQVFNRIHVADIGSACQAMMQPGAAPGTYNVTDDEPAPPQDVVAYAAGLLGVAVPPEQPYDDAVMTAMARSFYGENKRVSNRKLRQTLGVQLAYPTYREGLRALLDKGAA